METESPARPAGRPRPWLLVVLGVLLLIYLAITFMPGKSAPPAAAASKPRVQRGGKTATAIQPSDLDVRLEALRQPRPVASDNQRNPFRFYVPPPPPAPVVTAPPRVAPPPPILPEVNPGPQPPPPPPPIPLKFMGLLELPGGAKVAAFTDCRVTMRGREGEIIDGRYRLVRIGVESVVMEYLDGRGRTTIRMSGQDCVGK